MWQVFSRVVSQGSRLSATRLASSHAACDVLGLNDFHEDDLYENLDWLAENQDRIEDKLFQTRYESERPDLCLYDVTSSYFEGTCNELAAFGYNRDKKKGTMQVVDGLLCDFQGYPVSIQAFPGNTVDTKTFGPQVHKVARRKVQQKWEKLRLPEVEIKCDDRTLSVSKKEEAWNEASKLDGCYCLKTDLNKSQATKETVHDRYKGLSQVEWAFRISKTIELEARPIYVRKESRTRGHLLVVMLAYLLVQELAKCWNQIDATVEEGIDELATLCTTQVTVKAAPILHNIPTPRPSVERLLAAARVELPTQLASRGITVSTRKTLVEERKTA